MELSILPAQECCVLKENFPRKPYNKSFIDQVCLVKMALFFYEFLDRDGVKVHKHAKKELGQYPTILTSHLVPENIHIPPTEGIGNSEGEGE